MKTQLKFLSKEEAHRLIDEVPGDGIVILTYYSKIGISDNGKYIKKKKGKKIVDKASLIVLAQNNPVTILDLHKKYFENFTEYKRENIMKSILLPKLK